jgi:glycosyltransferase involved in cell wall biosynthesis
MQCDVVLVSSGYTDGPAQALFRWLKGKDLQACFYVHPLVPETNLGHLELRTGRIDFMTRVRHRPHRPPLTYLFDFTAPMVPARCETWVGFNCVSTFQGLLFRAMGRTSKVIHWNVDYVPRRFKNVLLNSLYESLDALCWRRSDLHVELTIAALQARSRHYGIEISNRDQIVPMGAWSEDVPKVSRENFDSKTIVFVGHLVQRMGVDILLRALPDVLKVVPVAKLRIVGDGPELEALKSLSTELKLDDHVHFTGFLNDSTQVDSELAAATVAVAPYRREMANFSYYADPGKLKMYTGCGVPILTSDVAPFAEKLFESGAAMEITSDETEFSQTLSLVLTNESVWNAMWRNSLALGQEYSWTSIFDAAQLPGLSTDKP